MKDIELLISKIEADKKSGILKSQAEFARNIGVEPQEITNWKARGSIPKDKQTMVCNYYKWTLDYLRGANTSCIKEGVAQYNISSQHVKNIKVPLISSVQAGDWTEAIEHCFDDTEQILCPYPHSDKTFAVKITGQSMSPEFPDGMIIFIDTSRMPENKEYCIAKLRNTNQATFKQYVIEDGQAYLKATNPDWPKKYINIDSNCQVIGRLIGVYLKY